VAIATPSTAGIGELAGPEDDERPARMGTGRDGGRPENRWPGL